MSKTACGNHRKHEKPRGDIFVWFERSYQLFAKPGIAVHGMICSPAPRPFPPSNIFDTSSKLSDSTSHYKAEITVQVESYPCHRPRSPPAVVFVHFWLIRSRKSSFDFFAPCSFPSMVASVLSLKPSKTDDLMPRFPPFFRIPGCAGRLTGPLEALEAGRRFGNWSVFSSGFCCNISFSVVT